MLIVRKTLPYGDLSGYISPVNSFEITIGPASVRERLIMGAARVGLGDISGQLEYDEQTSVILRRYIDLCSGLEKARGIEDYRSFSTSPVCDFSISVSVRQPIRISNSAPLILDAATVFILWPHQEELEKHNVPYKWVLGKTRLQVIACDSAMARCPEFATWLALVSESSTRESIIGVRHPDIGEFVHPVMKLHQKDENIYFNQSTINYEPVWV